MSLRINDTVPDFTADSSQGTIRFHDWIADEWKKRGAKVMGVSVDGVDEHHQWIGDIEKVGGAKVGFPIIADTDLKVSKAFDMLPAEAYLPDGRTPADTATVRAVYIIGPDKKVKLVMVYPMSVGRNFAEIVRALDGLQKTYNVPLATPANWEVGQDVIVATSLDDAAAEAKYGKLDKKLKYLRYAKA
jgi:alkyl hydroperoxide reductase subunit AhpC